MSTKYRIRPTGFTEIRIDGQTQKVPEYEVERGERSWFLFFYQTDWWTVGWTTNPEDFEEIIKNDALERAKVAQHEAAPARYAQTTLHMKSLSEPTPLYAVVHHLES
jgi:hypothetical protein